MVTEVWIPCVTEVRLPADISAVSLYLRRLESWLAVSGLLQVFQAELCAIQADDSGGSDCDVADDL